MKILNFIDDGRAAGGIVIGNSVYPFTELAKHIERFQEFRIADDVISSDIDQDEIDRLISEHRDKFKGISLNEVRLLPPVLRPGKILCIGVNYREHARESKQNVMEYPTIFCKFPDSIIGSGDAVNVPEDAEQIDYEGELVLVIGRDGPKPEDWIFGYTIGNDVSARDLQFRTSQWLLGKALPTFAPIGPIIVGRNELGLAGDLQIQTKVNGKMRQNGNTSDMIFDVKAIMTYLSKYFRLMPGDIVFTGTPEGVILGLPEKDRIWLKHGDTVEISITGIGTLTNKIA
ncbi:fumarylacetoacetate hydrolase family protein [Thermoplasma sp.]|uniref:fumarylacetoacetate hydrolase family protein n=1 Tax=Thermoplasma sp. TaxID=1973142 RepID=UPI0012890112|nr:fumarylacetoacetate hydrolase family protein [Thermoplasma sp.]KAA8922178.1 MAG: fumarylacetoacetate hydrolase family protein [Thermoplasma sp.]